MYNDGNEQNDEIQTEKYCKVHLINKQFMAL